MSYKVDSFKEEIENILNPKYKDFVSAAIEFLPDYFFEVPASSTGKFHPNYALGNGGLLRHTKAAVRVAIELFRLECLPYTDDERDIIIVSLILHDGFKSGVVKEQYTRADHPIVCAEQIRRNEVLKSMLDEHSFDLILSNIETHMGAFNTDFKTKKEILPKPKTRMQNFVHLVDFISSRKCLEFNFEVPINR